MPKRLDPISRLGHEARVEIQAEVNTRRSALSAEAARPVCGRWNGHHDDDGSPHVCGLAPNHGGRHS